MRKWLSVVAVIALCLGFASITGAAGGLGSAAWYALPGEEPYEAPPTGIIVTPMAEVGSINIDKYTSPVKAWPTEIKYVTSNFGYRYLNGTYDDDHYGIDIRTQGVKDVYAAGDGTVETVDNNACGGEGKAVYINHGNNWITRYYHLSEILVKQGDKVKAGDLIAKSGRTANCSDSGTEHHLHFEIRKNNAPFDPIAFYTSWTNYRDNIIVNIPTKRSGDSDVYVRTIQEALKWHGYNLTVDGIFGNNTKTAVESFQRANGLTVDGIVGPQTWRYLMGKID